MKISLVVAMAENRVIGRANQLPWHLPKDLKFFKRITMGKPMLMGRKTHESIGRRLPGRRNIVMTKDPAYQASGCIVVDSMQAGLAAAEPAEEIMVIGGATLYQQTLEAAQRIYLTLVQARIEGDVYLPEINQSLWQEVWRESHPADDRHGYPFNFMLLERKMESVEAETLG